MRYLLLLLLLPVVSNAQKFSATEIKKWQQQANNITIIRDNWGIPHV